MSPFKAGIFEGVTIGLFSLIGIKLSPTRKFVDVIYLKIID